MPDGSSVGYSVRSVLIPTVRNEASVIMVDGLTVVERETEWAVEVAGPDMYSPPRVLQCADENDARTYQRVFGGHLKSRERYVTDWASAS